MSFEKLFTWIASFTDQAKDWNILITVGKMLDEFFSKLSIKIH